MRSRHRSLSSPSLPPSNTFLGIFEPDYIPLYEWEISGYIGYIDVVSDQQKQLKDHTKSRPLPPSEIRCATGHKWEGDMLEAREALMRIAKRRGANAVVEVECGRLIDGSCYLGGTAVICRQIRARGQ